jgi:hypothetical protein
MIWSHIDWTLIVNTYLQSMTLVNKDWQEIFSWSKINETLPIYNNSIISSIETQLSSKSLSIDFLDCFPYPSILIRVNKCCLWIVWWLYAYLLFDDLTTTRVRRMDPEVNQGMVMETTQPKMKMKIVMILPIQASHLLNHTPLPSFPKCILTCFWTKLHDWIARVE